MTTNKHLFPTLFLFIALFSLTACNDSDNGDTEHEYTVEECYEISDDCKAFAKVESWEHECVFTEPETQGCLIEKEGEFYQNYYKCAKEKAGSQCRMLLLGEKKCLANCFFAKIDSDIYDQAAKECETECVNSY
ncbi:MAG: hypothetical protein GX444_19550 [Myxococcales bacterium]|nr:hypothetical protein [Myxococcales bacterium]